MMKKELKLIIGIILVGIMALSSHSVFAADGNSTIIIGNGSSTTTPTTENTTGNSTIIVGGNTTQTQTVNTTDTYQNATTNTTTLPKTGENDIYVVSALGLVCVISAVYAYRKIRNFNI